MTSFQGDLVRPFAGLRPAINRGNDIAAPPYDVVSVSEARQAAAGKPYSFFRVSRAEIELSENVDPYAPEVYEKAAQNLVRFEREGVLVRDPTPCFYVYRITVEKKIQTGIVALASVTAYLENRIKKHELTRPSKEDDRVQQIDAVNAHTGPVLCAHKKNSTLSTILNQASDGIADVIAENVGGARHELWAVSEFDQIRHISEIMNEMDALYIADGHHRSAAGARVSVARRGANPDHNGNESYNGFLVVSFPEDEVTIRDYNRVIKDLNGLRREEFLKIVENDFRIEPLDGPFRPTRKRTFGLYLAGQWSQLSHKSEFLADDPLDNLDVSVLTNNILEPVLGIQDQRTDPRIDFVGGSRGPEEVARRVDMGDMEVGFTVFPTNMLELMKVADAGLIMPPKSTWFEPKLADGIISAPLN